MSLGFSQEPVAEENRYAVDMLRINVGKKVAIVLNFSGKYPPERRTFYGVISTVGRDYFVLKEARQQNHLMAYFVNLAYLVFYDSYPNLPPDVIAAPPTHTNLPSPPTSPPSQQFVTSTAPRGYWWHGY